MQSPMQLLLVDDDENYRDFVAFALKQSFNDIQIKEAGTLQEALSLLLQEKFDCVLLDYNLPDGLGPELLGKRLQFLSNCPVIILTSMNEDSIGVSTLQIGAEDYLVKGEVTPLTLKRSIRYAIERYKHRSEFEKLTSDLYNKNLELKHANDKLQDLVVTDSLTGIANRRAFHARLTQLLSEARRGRKFALLMGDIDHFKIINDTHGHPIGDYVLTTVAQLLSSTARETDFVARYGGEEFCILIADVDEARAKLQAERLRKIIHTIDEYKITMSFGICVATADMNKDTLIRSADIALYHAKQKGRDCVVSFNDIKLLEPKTQNTFQNPRHL